jgi:hypothetical protein
MLFNNLLLSVVCMVLNFQKLQQIHFKDTIFNCNPCVGYLFFILCVINKNHLTSLYYANEVEYNSSRIFQHFFNTFVLEKQSKNKKYLQYYHFTNTNILKII